MKEIPLGRGFIAIIDDNDYGAVKNHNWWSSKNGQRVYAISSENGKTVYMHRKIIAPEKGMHVDHIDGNGLNNSRKNLRICTRSQNVRNAKKTLSKTTSLYKGVYFDKRVKLWSSDICVDRERIRLGFFKNQEDAALAYNFAAIKHHGQFARLNTAKSQ